MNKWYHQKRKIVALTKQGVNCWLAYVLAQPVDIDIAVVAFLIIDYFGVFSFRTESGDSSFFFSVSVSEDEKEKSFEKVIA